MNKFLRLLSLLFAVSFTSIVFGAETTKTTNVESGVQTTHIYQSDDPAVGDPGGKGISPREDRGPASTQKYCEEGSADPECVRAAKRQTSPTTWQQDCAAGNTKACGSSEK